jgi:hypothetical protein
MLPNVSQYSPQMNPGLFGQPGAYGGNASFGHESGQAGLGQQNPFGIQTNPFVQFPFAQPFTQPFAQNQFLPGLLATNPYLQAPWLQNSTAHNPFLGSFGGQAGLLNQAPQLVPMLGHLAQQVAVQSAVTQQIGIVLHQLAQQLAGQSIQGHPGAGFGAGQPFAGAGGQYFGQNPFGGAAQGGYGFNPQAQAWGANRAQTIQ